MPKIIDHDAYRNEIITKLTQLLLEEGAGVGMREMADYLGVSKSALYHYFPSKGAILNAVLEQALEEDFSGFLSMKPAGGALEERLEAIIHYTGELEEWFMQFFLLATDYLLNQAEEGDEIPQVFKTFASRTAAFLKEYLEIEDLQAAEALTGLMIGLFFLRFLDGGSTEYKKTARWLGDLIIASQT